MKNDVLPRALLACAAFIFAGGGVLHAAAYFSKAHSVIEGAGVKVFFGNELKVLWLADSTTLVGLALALGLLSLRPAHGSRVLLLLLALVPGAITILLYAYLGPFYAAHLLLLGSIMVIIAALLMKERPSRDAPVGSQWRPLS
jgi:hypothetical protein